MPDITSTGAALLADYRNERRIELAYEDQRPHSLTLVHTFMYASVSTSVWRHGHMHNCMYVRVCIRVLCHT